jgi:hypothetical protein
MASGTGIGPNTQAMVKAPRLRRSWRVSPARRAQAIERGRVDRADDSPRLGKADLVADELEDPDRALGLAQGPGTPLALLTVELHEKTAQLRLGREAVITGGLRGRDRPGEHPVGLGELAQVHQCLPEVGKQPQPVGVELGHEVDRTPQEAGRRMHVPAGERALAGARQPLPGAASQLAAVVVQRAEIGQVGVRLLQVISAYSGARSPFT